MRSRARGKVSWMRRKAAVLWTVLALLVVPNLPALAGPAPVQQIEVRARPITQFHIGRTGTQFGPLEFIGGLELTSRSRDFGGLSAFRFLKPGSDFIGVTDTGFWYFGTLARDENLRPVAVENARMVQMIDREGETVTLKEAADAESLAVKNGVAVVGFEREHRVSQFRIDPDAMGPPERDLDFLIPAHELRKNRGFETVAYVDPHGPGDGLMVVSEKSLDKAGNIFAAVIQGSNKGIFTVKRIGNFDITDGAFLPNGDLLLLERSFSMAEGVAMRLRRISAEDIAPGKLADGPILLEADMGYQIDNMEGLDVWQRSDGATMISIVSDDNLSILQRNLYLEFRLHED